MPSWVVDASPLILLGKIHRIDLLTDLAHVLVIPSAVVDEINAGPNEDPARQWLAHSGFTYIEQVTSIAPEVAAWDPGKGEGAVLSWAYQRPGWRAIIDDAAARHCARALGISTIGTIGVFLIAKRLNRIPAAKPLFTDLLETGMRMSAKIIDQALRQVGELE